MRMMVLIQRHCMQAIAAACFALSLLIGSSSDCVCCRAVLRTSWVGMCMRRLDHVHVDAIVAEVLRRLDRPRFEAPTYAVDLKARVQVQSTDNLSQPALLACRITVWRCCDNLRRL